MIFSRLCVWRSSFQVRKPLYGLIPTRLHHVREVFKRHLQPNTTLCFKCNRTFSSNSRPQATPETLSKTEKLARSRPRLMKELEAEKKKDNLTPEWDLIFTSKRNETKMVLVHWVSFVSLCAMPFLTVTNFWELEHEDDVIIASVSVTKRTEYLLFILVNVFIMTMAFKNVRCVPKRIYFNEKTGNYLALCRSWFPWSTVRKQFKASDIRKLPFRIIATEFKFWKDTEFLVSNRRLALPHMSFRSGQDRYFMLRHVDTD